MKEFRSKRLRVWENINRTMQEFKVLLLGYRSYTALLTQSGTDVPVATVLENTIGDIIITRDFGPGEYGITLDGGFPVDKTFIVGFGRVYGNNTTTQPITDGGDVTGYYNFYYFIGDKTVYSYFYDENFINVDLSHFGDCTIPIEIRIYN
jgi:hypothetical protein